MNWQKRNKSGNRNKIGKVVQGIKEKVYPRTDSSSSRSGEKDENRSGCIRLCN